MLEKIMKSKPQEKSKISITGLVVIAFLLIVIFFLILILPNQDPPKNTNVSVDIPTQQNLNVNVPNENFSIPELVNAGLPVRIKIPKIKVDTTIESVGLTPQGAMGVPTSLVTTTWFNLGPRPGEIGSAVIAGHYGWEKGVAAVFNSVHKLIAGDTIVIEDENGVTFTFVVRELRSFAPKANASDVFSSNDEKAHLNLVTCEGTWNAVQKSYSDRLVVFADKE